MNKILVPVDFTPASDKACERAYQLALRTGAEVNFLHVVTGKQDAEGARIQLGNYTDRWSGVRYNVLIREGHVLETINKVSKEGAYSLMIVGTHGARGLRQNLFGADVLKLLRGTHCPAIVLQEDADSKNEIKKILLPVGSHAGYLDLVHAAAMVALIFNAQITFYRIARPLEEEGEELIENIRNAKIYFDQHKILWDEWVADTSVFSFGFAKQTILDAEKKGYDLIGILPHSSAVHSYFANADKELLLTNESNIPILSSAGEE